MKLVKDYPEVVQDAERRGLIIAHTKHWHNPEKGICLALCQFSGPSGECNHVTEKLCWIHQESLEKGYHLGCANDQESLKLVEKKICEDLGIPLG